MEALKIDDTFMRVSAIVSEVFSLRGYEITENTNIREDLGADSIDSVTLLGALEDEFGGKIDDNEAMGLVIVKDIVTFIEEKMLYDDK